MFVLHHNFPYQTFKHMCVIYKHMYICFKHCVYLYTRLLNSYLSWVKQNN